jgi:hypothetical protein
VFRIRREFLDDLAGQRLIERIARLQKALLVFHAPLDETVGIDNANRIFTAAKHPKSFISLSGADHLLSRKSDAMYVGHVIEAWVDRYLDKAEAVQSAEETESPADASTVVVTENGRGPFQQDVKVGRHRLIADEPVSTGGLDGGPDPYGYLLAALGACTAMTLRLYADRKLLPLRRVSVEQSATYKRPLIRRVPYSPRFRSLAAFGRRPWCPLTGRVGRHPKPITRTDSCTALVGRRRRA